MIRCLQIRNFRCFRDFSFDGMGAVTIVGGRNNCGKTSFGEAIYCLDTGAVASSFADLIGNRRMPVSRTDLALSFSDGDTTKERFVSGSSAGSKTEVVARVKEREEQKYTGDAEKDARLAKVLEVDEKNREAFGREKVFQSKFYYVLNAESPVPGGFAGDGWLLFNACQGKTKVVYLASSVQRDVCLYKGLPHYTRKGLSANMRLVYNPIGRRSGVPTVGPGVKVFSLVGFVMEASS